MDPKDKTPPAPQPPPPPEGYDQEGWEETLAWQRHLERQRGPVGVPKD